EILTWSLTGLFTQLLLLALDPMKFGNGKHTNVVEVHPERCGDPHLACWRIDTQVDIFDAFLHHIHRDVTQRNLHNHQYSFCCLIIRKIRSTSSTFCKISYRAALIT